MKAKDIDMSQFKSIDELYEFVDKHAYELERNWDIVQLFIGQRNQATSEDEKQKAQFEIDCLHFDFKGKILFSQVYAECKNENVIAKYPDLNLFEKEAIEYVIARAQHAKNPILKARYNHLLWKSRPGIKNKNYALSAIENYISAIKNYYALYEADNHKETPFEIGRLYENLVAVCSEINSDVTQLKALTNFLLFKAKKLKFYTIHGILEDMLEYPKLFKPIDFEQTLSIFDKELKQNRRKVDDFNLVSYHLPTAIKIATKTKSDVKKWHNEVGLAYLRLANEEVEENRYWIKQRFHAEAIKAFALAGNKDKKKEVEALYAQLKPKIKLPGFSQQIELPQKHIIAVANNVLKESANKVYEIIASGYLFPKYDEINKFSKNNETSFLDYCTTVQFDINKNISNLRDEDVGTKKIFDTYNFYISVCILPYLYHVFIPGIKSGHLTYENFIAFLSEKTWIGSPHMKCDLSGEEQPTNWIALLAPSIIEFFLQTQAWLNSKYYLPSYVLCIDSLVLKMEGLLRDFSERLNIPTSVNRKNGMEEVYVNNILENEIIKEHFDKDDMLFFNYLLSNEGGMNLRNNVAHCFLDYSDYNLSKILLLIAGLLRIGKFYYNENKSPK